MFLKGFLAYLVYLGGDIIPGSVFNPVHQLVPLWFNDFKDQIVFYRLHECQHFLSERKAEPAVNVRVIPVIVDGET